MNLRRQLIFLILALCCSWAAAQAPAVSADIRLSRIGDDTWRVDYVFSRPVTTLTMERVGDYRRDGWKLLTPGVRLASDSATGFDVLSKGGRPFRQLSVEVRSYTLLLPKQYLAVDQFSDGGRLFYLGFLGGEVAAGAAPQPLVTHVRLAGRPGETTLAPPPARPGSSDAYAYFGPQRPSPAGSASAIFDPATPDWVRATMLDATAKVSSYYARAYGRVPAPALVLMATMGDTTARGLSMKGGAIGSQIAYHLSGDQFKTDDPRKRSFIAQLVAHEMAHVWQQQVARGGMGEEAPWVHEGGAEAMAHDALLKTQIWDAATGDAFIARTLKRCAAEGDGVTTYDGRDACGFKRFHATGVEAGPLWRAMMRLTEETAAPYSPEMVERAAGEVRAGAGAAL
jgi:hypothetical protein